MLHSKNKGIKNKVFVFLVSKKRLQDHFKDSPNPNFKNSALSLYVVVEITHTDIGLSQNLVKMSPYLSISFLKTTMEIHHIQLPSKPLLIYACEKRKATKDVSRFKFLNQFCKSLGHSK